MEIRENKVTFKSGKIVTKYVLTNNNGMSVELISLGGTLTKIMVPDAEGRFENVLLEWQDIELYEQHPGSFGAIVGRTAGRIGDGKVTIDGQEYHFYKNNNGNTLHGGKLGFDHKNFEGKAVIDEEGAKVILTYLSVDGEEGYPGNLQVKITYILKDDNTLTIDYKGETDQETIVNLTNHAYFNLSGNAKRSVLDEEVYLNSDEFYSTDANLIPDGTMISVDEMPVFDFRVPKTIGQDIKSDNKVLRYGNGYDHVFKLKSGKEAVKLFDPTSRRFMSVTTDAPCVVMYTMNGADSSLILSNGESAKPNYAVCFETQRPAIGHNEVFKDLVLLKKGEVYSQITTFKFGIL